MLKAIADSLLSLTHPQACHVCSSHVTTFDDGIACSNCWQATRVFAGSEDLCSKCGAFLGDVGAIGRTECPDCADHQFDAARSVGLYEKALAATILHLKKEPHLARRAKRLFIDRLTTGAFSDAAVVMPVPLARKRMHERGFNQAQVLAEIAGKAAGLPVDSVSLSRGVHTPMHRAAMDRKARIATVKDAFEVLRPKLVEGRHVVLVDDVLTSGATASACAGTLKANGAASVSVFTLARVAWRSFGS